MKGLIKGFIGIVVLHAGFIGAFAIDNPQVPSEMKLGDLKLRITDGARREIQKDVDALRASPKYFQIKVDRMNLYFPIIERILKEEKVPDEFKFLAIQESALISDAVSSANAVGFWQFKEPAGREVGLRIDKYVDERLNIVAASRGAAKYLKRMNFYFNNWAYACLAYNRGPGGAKKYVEEKNFGVKRMTIDKGSFWYVKKFLAHIVAFQDEVGKPHSAGLSLIEYDDGANKSLRQVAKDIKADEELVNQYNKWLKRGNIPGEKIYPVVVPFKGKNSIVIASKSEKRTESQPQVEIYPDITRASANSKNLFVKVNKIKAIVAATGDKIESLAEKGGIQVHHLVKFNDLGPTDQIDPGEIYYLRKKRNKSSIFYHTVSEGESMWDISQKYGIKLKKLRSFNRMTIEDDLETNRILWLGKKRPKSVEIEYANQVAPKIPTPIAQAETSEPEPQEEKEEVKQVFKLEEIPDEFITEERPKSNAPITPKIQAVNEPSEITYHLVRKGETLYSISRMYTVKVDEIKKWNDLSTNDLKPGMNLQLIANEEIVLDNPATKEKAQVSIHEVIAGETLYSIARQYNLSVKDLIEINLIEDGDALQVGQKLQLAKGDDPEFKERVNDPKFHVVSSGETMYGVAKKFQLTLKELMSMNGKNDTALSVGERLKISE